MTATVAIEAALQLLGVLDSGGSASTAQKNDGLLYLQGMVENANDDPRMAIASTVITQALSGAASYTITRYSKILAASVAMTNGVTMPVRVLQDAGQFFALVDATSTSSLVQYCWYDRASSSPKVYVSPVAGNGTLNLVVPAAITNFADLTTPITILQGYELWIKLNLAHLLASTYDVAVPDSVTQELTKVLATIQTLNAELLAPSPVVTPVAQHVVTA
jgi:hypothetical protein